METDRVISMHVRGGRGDIALRGVHVQSQVAGTVQETAVVQAFVNTETVPVEAVYTFPLPENAAVSGLEVMTNGRLLTGVVDEADAACEQYDDAIIDGDSAYLLESQRPDVFTINVGNINPGQEAIVRISYVAELVAVDGMIRFEFPACMAPRYVTGTGSRASSLDVYADGDALNPPHHLTVPYGMSAEVTFDSVLGLSAISSPSHALTTRQDERGWHVSLRDLEEPMDRALVISVELVAEQEPAAVLCCSGDREEQFVAVTFVPELDPEAADVASEVIFLIDCSGSMNGSSIEQARQALALCLRTLAPGDTFNICCFGSRHEFMSRRPVEYDDASLRDALRYVARIDATLGGTEIYRPLEQILKGRLPRGRRRQVVLLTDGQVSNEPAVLKMVRQRAKGSRIFSFGIGAAASRYLVGECARLTGGMAEFIADGERIEPKVLRTFSRMASPCVEKLALQAHDGSIELADEQLGPVFDGEALTILARVDGLPPTQLTLRATTRDGAYTWDLPVDTAARVDTPTPRLWARRRIQALETEALSSRRHDLKRQLVAVSKRYGIICQHTAYVAVEHRSAHERNSGIPALRRVPVSIPAGWGGIQQTHTLSRTLKLKARGPANPMGVLSDMAGAAPASPGIRRAKRRAAPRAGSAKASASLMSKLFGAIGEGGVDSLGISAGAGTTTDPLFELLSRQSAGGDFRDAPRVVCDEVRRELAAETQWQAQLTDPVVQTIAVLVLLERQHAERSAMWRRASRKAIKWLAQQTGLSVGEIREMIARFLQPCA